MNGCLQIVYTVMIVILQTPNVFGRRQSVDHSYQQSSMLLPGPVVTRYVVGYFPRTTFGVSLLYAEHDRMLAPKVPPS